MKKKYTVFLILAFISWKFISAQVVTIHVDASQGRKAISPYIYGKNNNISDDPGSPTTAAEWKLMREAGLRFTRENGGNNATKYNWRLKLSSHPDWYNNVYAHNWDYAAKMLSDSMPGVQGMWAFQLIGKAASNTSHNFNDYAYNGSTWWSGVCQNLAGGGVANAAGTCTATTNGNPNLYLENWTADSTVGILDHWFGTGGLNYNQNNIRYWSMDNEPDIWNSTHDDVMPAQPAAEAFMQLYFAAAKKARAKFPNIKLCGPVPA
ncbi:MAG: glycoside hydrolase family 44 protein, partial [Bacteroidia bacterium]